MAADQAFLVVNTIAIVLTTGVFAGVFAEKYRVPKMVVLIMVGIFFSFFKPSVIVDFGDEAVKELTLIIAELGLILVLYQEGMHLSLRRLKDNVYPIAILAVLGTILTATIVGLVTASFASGIIGLDVEFLVVGSLLMASIVVPTDPAATFAILRSTGDKKVKSHLESILGGESAFNDVIAILLVIVILLPQVETNNTSLDLNFEFILIAFWQLIGGIILGVVVSMISLFLISKVNTENETASLSLAGAMGIFYLSHQINVSGAIAALIGGLILSNPHYVGMKRRYTNSFMVPFWNKLIFLIEIFAFTFVGILFLPENFNRFIIVGLVLSIIVILVRIFTVFISTIPLEWSPKTENILNSKERIFISLAGFKGLTTAVLALLSYVTLTHAEGFDPQQPGYAELILYGSLSLILVSGIIQGLLLPLISDKLEIWETYLDHSVEDH